MSDLPEGAAPAAVTLLYTANLKGNLALVPQLFSLIKTERETAVGPIFLLDLGDTCSLDSWICHATQGRAPLLLLDSMGYDAVLLGGSEEAPIPPASLRRLLDVSSIRFIIGGRLAALSKQGITVGVMSGHAAYRGDIPGIVIDRTADTLPDQGNAPIVLGDVPQGNLARVDIRWPEWDILYTRLTSLSSEVIPDPTVSAMIEFIESEARLHVQQQGEAP